MTLFRYFEFIVALEIPAMAEKEVVVFAQTRKTTILHKKDAVLRFDLKRHPFASARVGLFFTPYMLL